MSNIYFGTSFVFEKYSNQTIFFSFIKDKIWFVLHIQQYNSNSTNILKNIIIIKQLLLMTNERIIISNGSSNVMKTKNLWFLALKSNNNQMDMNSVQSLSTHISLDSTKS